MMKAFSTLVAGLLLFTGIACDEQPPQPASEVISRPKPEVSTDSSTTDSQLEPMVSPDDRSLEYLIQLQAQLNGRNESGNGD